MKSFYLFLFTIACIHSADGQKWVKMMQDPQANFYDIQKEFNREWNSKEKEMIQERGKHSGSEEDELQGGYMPFKRWEYFMEPRVYPTGDRMNHGQAWNNYKAYLADQAKKHQGNQMQGASNWSIIGPVS